MSSLKKKSIEMYVRALVLLAIAVKTSFGRPNIILMNMDDVSTQRIQSVDCREDVN